MGMGGGSDQTRRLTLRETQGGAVAYDPGTKVLQYLHFNKGVSEKMSRTRRQILEADVDLPAEAVRATMQMAKDEGLEINVPADLLENLKHLVISPLVLQLHC